MHLSLRACWCSGSIQSGHSTSDGLHRRRQLSMGAATVPGQQRPCQPPHRGRCSRPFIVSSMVAVRPTPLSSWLPSGGGWVMVACKRTGLTCLAASVARALTRAIAVIAGACPWPSRRASGMRV